MAKADQKLRLQSYSYGNMQSFKIVAYFLLVCTDSGGYVKFTPKYTLVGGEGGVSEFFLRFQSYSFGNSGPHAKFQNRSLFLLGCTDSGGYVKFTPKYTIVGVEGGVSEFLLRFQSYSFGNSGPHAKFHNHSFPLSGLY